MTLKTFDDTAILNLDGTTLKERAVTKNQDGIDVELLKDLTIKSAIVAALQNSLKGDETLTIKQVLSNVSLAERIYKGGELLLESEDITNIKERVAKAWGQPIVLYRVVNFLEN